MSDAAEHVARRHALAAPGAEEDLARHIIDFDPRDPGSYLFSTAPGTRAAMARVALAPNPIPWPAGLAPTPTRPTKAPALSAPLPTADVLIVTYTVAEGYALADVLTPGWGHASSPTATTGTR